jgi:DNA helicase-2/ATP-dependent DNA helicase PcrA
MNNDLDRFLEALDAPKIIYKKINTSDIIGKEKSFRSIITNCSHLVIFQDLQLNELIKVSDGLVNRLVHPLLFRKCPVSFFSILDRTEYSNIKISSNDIHSDSNSILSRLYIEQLDNLLSQNNFIYSAPTNIEQTAENSILTPIEQLLQSELERRGIQYKAQQRFGKYTADFLVQIAGNKAIVECDGKDYHIPERDKIRDAYFEILEYPTYRISGSEIYRDVSGAVDRLEQNISQPTKKRIYEIDADLDNSQLPALSQIYGPVRLLAPAGSGKTKTIVNRIIHIVNNGISENQILALAFNKKAALEMENRLCDHGIRVATRLDDEGVNIRTFHSIGLELVKKTYHWSFDGTWDHINRMEHDIIKKVSQNDIVSVKPWEQKELINALLDRISKTKCELLPDKENELEILDKKISMDKIFADFLRCQKDAGFFNFDDHIYFGIRALIDNRDLRMMLQRRFNYILIDEFQDLNEAQILMMKILAMPNNNLYIVGDDDQMIYGWRGAHIDHILNFPDIYSISKDFVLSINYRCSKRIIKHSSWLINHNTKRIKKKIEPCMNAKDGTFVIEMDENPKEQTLKVANWILDTIKKTKDKYGKFCILYRYHEFQFPLAMALDSKGIPHTPVNNEKLFQKAPAKDLLSYLQVILEPKAASPEDYYRILDRPNKYINKEIKGSIENWDMFKKLPTHPQFKDFQKEQIEKFISTIESLQNEAITKFQKPETLVSAIFTNFQFENFYKNALNSNRDIDKASDDIIMQVLIAVASNYNNHQEFLNLIKKSIDDQLTDQNEIEDDGKDKVLLSTIHSAKGKEFKNVVLFNLSKSKSKTKIEEEEERRVCYVGITRAIDNILITAPKQNYSQFLLEMALNPKYPHFARSDLINNLSGVQNDITNLLANIENNKKTINQIKEKHPEITGHKLMVLMNSRIKELFQLNHELLKEYPEIDNDFKKEKLSILTKIKLALRSSYAKDAKYEYNTNLNEIENEKKEIKKRRIYSVENAKDKIRQLISINEDIENNRIKNLKNKTDEIEEELKMRKSLNYNK